MTQPKDRTRLGISVEPLSRLRPEMYEKLNSLPTRSQAGLLDLAQLDT